jgi:phage-related protein
LPKILVVFFQEADGHAPVREWLRALRNREPRAHARCVARIRRLAALGHELRRPEADNLQDGVHELRARSGHVHYRLLYVFHGREVAVLLHALTKEGAVPAADIHRALLRKMLLDTEPDAHMHEDP